MAEEKTSGFVWRFQRLGGLVQVVLQKAEEFRRLRELDPKLWVALSCPAQGLQFDQRTLTLIDTDKDGRIRIPEVVEAVEWTCARLKNPESIREPGDLLHIVDITDDTEDGRRLALTAKAILANLDKAPEDGLTEEDVTRAIAHASEQMFNGDGILPPMDGFGADMAAFIKDAMAVIGGVRDAGGEAGIDRAIADAFVGSLKEWAEWKSSVGSTIASLEADAPEAWDLISELREKIDDYFLRCDLAAYAPSAMEKLGIDPEHLASPEHGILEDSLLAELPLSRVDADKPLDLRTGINPAWRSKTERLAVLLAPLLATPGILTRDEWLRVQEHFEPYAQALAKKPAPPTVTADVPPTMKVDKLGEERIREILSGDLYGRFLQLAEKDADIPAAAADIARVERLVRYRRHLYRLLVNFVNFEEFYSLRRTAAFQSGKLYIDSRCSHLCMPAEKVEEHAALAANSQLYLLYCDCVRGPGAGEKEPAKTTIVAAVTAGDSDLLMQNRNGVYVDNNGADWDATVVKIVPNPIGLWEAIWSPYKKVGGMIADQIGKLASDKQTDLMSSAGQKIGELSKTPATPPTAAAAPTKFDIGRSVGIFAAVGLALGAIGTAIGSCVNALLGMAWWQLPLLLVALFLVISGPSVVMAWLKLRKRTLGPLLEASGWAINGRVTVNYTLARRLTSTATLPPNAKKCTRDPLSRARHWQRIAFYLALLVGAALVGLWTWRQNRLPETPSAGVEAPVEAPGEPTPPKEPDPEDAAPSPAAVEEAGEVQVGATP